MFQADEQLLDIAWKASDFALEHISEDIILKHKRVDSKDLLNFPAKDWFLFQSLRQIRKSLLIIEIGIKGNDNISELINRRTAYSENANNDWEGAQTDFISALTRKLRELLIRLIFINKKKTNINLYYHHYILLEQLDQKKRINKNNKIYFGIKNELIGHQELEMCRLQRLLEEQGRDGEKFDCTKVWYSTIKQKSFYQFNSETNLYSECLKICDPCDKLLLGISKNAYDQDSHHIHINFSPNKTQLYVNDADCSYTHALILIFSLLSNVKQLLFPSKSNDNYDEISKILNSKVLFDFLHAQSAPQINVGDLVCIQSCLAIIIGKTTVSDFGNIGFKVEFIQECPKDCDKIGYYTPDIIRLILGKKELDTKIMDLFIRFIKILDLSHFFKFKMRAILEIICDLQQYYEITEENLSGHILQCLSDETCFVKIYNRLHTSILES